MKKILVLLFALFAFSFSHQLSHPLRVAESAKRQTAAVNDTLNILAIMVQFQEDNTDLTSGNGKFNLTPAPEPIIDPPPYDSAYFYDHFIFAQNYFAKASNGKQHIKATVLGDTITLSKQMKAYAPLNGNLPLAQMIEEAWKKADSMYANTGIAFQNYDLFVLFHAGVGKDVDLRGTLGYDPTPYDLPSLYFNLPAFKNLFGNDFSGIPVQNSSFSIQNTIVLPSTEVRQIPSIGGDLTLKLGINGLLVASIASHLGLPDLFDTKTGRTAIGRFGLMDGQAIFSFSGICPPEPSAWEKTYLGWTTPIEVYGTDTLGAPAVGLYQTGNDTVYRIPISAKEYFLVENRQRDAHENGDTVTMKWNGNIIKKVFTKDEDFYSNTNIDSVYGVVLNVDELDWSLPGLVNDNNNYKGGILIWHIDETIIEKNLAANSINADPLKRGVDVEEADGSQDIGQTYDFISPGSGSEDGWSLDYWFNGNIAPVYKNEFSETTHPNSLSNSFAQSHVTVKNFSASSPRMTFEANIGDANIQLVKVIKRNNLKLDNNDAPIAADLDGDGSEELIYTSGDSIYALKHDLTPYLNNTTGLFAPFGGKFQPAFYKSSDAGSLFPRGLVAAADSSIYFFNPLRTDSIANANNVTNVGDVITTPVTARNSSPLDFFVVGTRGGKYVVVDTARSSIQTFYSPIVSVSSTLVATVDSIAIGAARFKMNAPVISVGTASFDNRVVAIVQTVSTITLLDIHTSQLLNQFELLGHTTSPMLLTDINNDHSPEIVVGTGNKIYAFNINGSVADNFPFSVEVGDTIVGSIIVNNNLLVFGTKKGLLFAINGKGKVVDGFPLQTSGMVSAPFVGSDYLVSASTDTSMYVWKYSNQFDPTDRRWQTYLGTLSHTSEYIYFGSAEPKSSELLPKSFAYNWPNPAYGGTTNIRYFLGKSATVKIKIINLAGELVDELLGTNYVGLDNEVQWDVSKIQSGIYFAQITASGSGEEQNQIIKIAVVK